MTPVLFDADAFLCIRTLSLLRALDSGAAAWLMTERIARWELSTIAIEIDALRTKGRLVIHALPARGSPSSTKYWLFVKKGHDKGEAEAIAWASELNPPERPLFISNDTRARELARANGVPAGDIMDLAVAAVLAGDISKDKAQQILAVWQDKRQSLCRPGDFTSFDETFAKREAGSVIRV